MESIADLILLTWPAADLTWTVLVRYDPLPLQRILCRHPDLQNLRVRESMEHSTHDTITLLLRLHSCYDYILVCHRKSFEIKKYSDLSACV